MTSPILTAGSTPDELYFFYHVYGSSVQLEAAAGNGWTPLWSAAWQGGQDQDWALARVAIPPDAGLLRFVGTLTGGSNDGVALDGIGLEAPNVDFLGLSCDFRWHTCSWFNNGNSAWQRVASEADESWFLEASTNVSVDQTFVLESARFNAGKGLLLKYQLEGSGSISLQAQLEGGSWLKVFQQTTTTIITAAATPFAAATGTELVNIPTGTLALRILANITQAEDVVRVYSVRAVRVFKDISCNSEFQRCGWEAVYSASEAANPCN